MTTKIKKTKLFSASKEFVVGKHNIGYVSTSFNERFGKTQFKPKALGTFQKLLRKMSDTEIESELKPGLCELGDVLAFLENAPEEGRDGRWNFFYTASCVVHVSWSSGCRSWSVGAWGRGGSWSAGKRVFSPETNAKNLDTESLEPSDTLGLEKAIEVVKKAGYVIYKPI